MTAVERAIVRNAEIAAAMGVQLPDAEAVEAFRQALARMDWTYDFSDDYSVWAAGSNALRELYRMQAQVDPTGEIWRERVKDMKGVAQPRVLVDTDPMATLTSGSTS